jgi:nicotinamide phosphoribosyltransferase
VNNILLDTDSYKYTHWKQYPPGTERIYSYLESRGGDFDYTVFFGLQPILQTIAEGFSVDHVEEANEIAALHFGQPLFNYNGFMSLARKHHGRFPVTIKAVPEGTVVPTGNVLMTIENTDPEFPWVTNFLETMLLRVWYPTTVATQSRVIKELVLKYLVMTGDPTGIMFKLHDFGCRGVSSWETAGIGGAAHLVNFLGTDTIPALVHARRYYQEKIAGYSIAASEHSTITAWGRDREVDAYRNMLTSYPTGLVACVSDSYDIEHAIRAIWGGVLRDQVLARSGTLVIRPDSGDPPTMVLKCLRILEERFGVTVNNKGYKVLPSQVRLIQGDGVNLLSIAKILEFMAIEKFSADNIAFGMGGALLQQLNRDTLKFAIKCSNVTINGVDQPVYKDPVTDTGKKSKRGRLQLCRSGSGWLTLENNVYRPDLVDQLEVVLNDGMLTSRQLFSQVRERAALAI